VSAPAAPRPGGSWEEASAAFGDAIRDWYGSQGHDPDAPAAQSTVSINTTRVPSRVADLLAALRDGTGRDGMRGLDVLDVGCGYGAMTVFIRRELGARDVVGEDVREDYLDVARRALNRLAVPADGVAFRLGDMTRLRHPDRSRDMILVHNAFCYLTGLRRAREAMSEFHRVLRPGGVVLVYQPNRWHPFEAFTRLPLVHWLPRRLTERVIVASGRRSTWSDIRLWSPWEMRRLGSGAGFVRIRNSPLRRSRRWRGPLAALAPYYYTTAVRPPG
jgi:SAM-dependent methyltransferase